MKESEKPPNFWISFRFLLTLVAFLGYAMQYVQRINMSVAIVCMINNTALKQHQYHGIDDQYNQSFWLADFNSTVQIHDNVTINPTSHCLFHEASKEKSLDGQFDWDKQTQGLILSAFFYGYLTSQIIGGYLSIKLGAKVVLTFSILAGSILTVLMPFAAKYNFKLLVACRFLVGSVNGVFWPSMSTLWAYWAPKSERSRMLGIASAGAQIGNVIALFSGGFLCVYGFGGGWPSIFYIYGIAGFVWSILWFIISSRSPAENRFISKREKEYIMANTKEAVANVGKMPLKVMGRILISRAWWAMVISHVCSNFGTFLFLTQLPTYMKEILKFSIKTNAALSALPYIACWLFSSLSGIVGDKLIESKRMSRTNVRKLFTALGLLLPMCAVIGLAFVTCAEPYIGVALLTFALAATGCSNGAGFLVNANDYAGSYAGMAFGLSNSFASVPGMVAPYMVGVITKTQAQSEWRLVFFITAGVYLVGALVYLVIGTGELQSWAQLDKKSVEEKETSNKEDRSSLVELEIVKRNSLIIQT